MKILRKRLTKDKAAELCRKMKLSTAIKLRLGEILELESDPKEDPVARRLSHDLHQGYLISLDREKHEIFGITESTQKVSNSSQRNILNQPSTAIRNPPIKNTGLSTGIHSKTS